MVNPGSFIGTRGTFIQAQTQLYADAVKDNHVADTVADIQRRYFKRFPVTLRDDEEPSEEWLTQVDDDAPDEEFTSPDVSSLSEDAADKALAEYNDLIGRTKFKKEQIKRRLHYIYSKNRDDDSEFDKLGKDPIASITSKLLGVEFKLPRRKTAYNVWGPKHRASVDPIFNARVKDLRARKEQHMAIRSAVYKELFEKLPASEQQKWTQIAEREHEKIVADAKRKFKNSIPSTPEAHQRVIAALPKVIEPILDAVCDYTGWKASFIAGGPEPADGGRLNMISIHSGLTAGSVKMDFGRSQKQAYKHHIAPAFGSFLKKCYSVQDCRESALPQDHSCVSINDVAEEEDISMQVHTFESDTEHENAHKPRRPFEDIAKSGKSTKRNHSTTGTPSSSLRFGPPIGKKKNRILPSKDAALVKLGPSPLSQSFVPGPADTASESSSGSTSAASHIVNTIPSAPSTSSTAENGFGHKLGPPSPTTKGSPPAAVHSGVVSMEICPIATTPPENDASTSPNGTCTPTSSAMVPENVVFATTALATATAPTKNAGTLPVGVHTPPPPSTANSATTKTGPATTTMSPTDVVTAPDGAAALSSATVGVPNVVSTLTGSATTTTSARDATTVLGGVATPTSAMFGIPNVVSSIAGPATQTTTSTTDVVTAPGGVATPLPATFGVPNAVSTLIDPATATTSSRDATVVPSGAAMPSSATFGVPSIASSTASPATQTTTSTIDDVTALGGVTTPAPATFGVPSLFSVPTTTTAPTSDAGIAPSVITTPSAAVFGVSNAVSTSTSPAKTALCTRDAGTTPGGLATPSAATFGLLDTVFSTAAPAKAATSSVDVTTVPGFVGAPPSATFGAPGVVFTPAGLAMTAPSASDTGAMPGSADIAPSATFNLLNVVSSAAGPITAATSTVDVIAAASGGATPLSATFGAPNVVSTPTGLAATTPSAIDAGTVLGGADVLPSATLGLLSVVSSTAGPAATTMPTLDAIVVPRGVATPPPATLGLLSVASSPTDPFTAATSMGDSAPAATPPESADKRTDAPLPPSSPTRASLPPSPQQSPPSIKFGGAAQVPNLSDIEATPTKGHKRRGTGVDKENDGQRASKRLKTTAAAPSRKRKAEVEDDSPKKRQRGSGGGSFTVPAPAGCQPWVNKALKLLTSRDLGLQWRRLVEAWLDFEKAYGFEEKRKPFLPPLGRPEVVGQWIKRGRDPNWIPGLDEMDVNESTFNSWWRSLQPNWRVAEGEGLRRQSGQDWGLSLSRSGVNGFLSIVAALFFWGHYAIDSPTAPVWAASVDDALYALQEIAKRS